MRRIPRRVFWWSAAGAASVFGVLFAVAVSQIRSDHLRDRIVETLAVRLNADVTMETFDVTILPRLKLSGTGLQIRVRNRADLPPFISIARFTMDVGLLSLTRRHVDTVHVDGLDINVPPKDARRTLGGPAGDDAAGGGALSPSKVLIDHLVTHDARLHFYSNKPNKRPLEFEIRDLELEDLGFDRPVPFRAKLTNPRPTGLIETSGTFGPLAKHSPADTNVQGRYSFDNADLSTISGLKGILTSTGVFEGRIGAIEVSGSTDTPDFSLDMGGKPVPLRTTFAAMVDGTDGTVILRKVDATLQGTHISTTGAITNLPGPAKHAIDLDVNVRRGRIEDFLGLLSAKPPVARGDIVLHTRVHLPPGKTPVLSRMTLEGQFSLAHTQFREQFQAKIQELSRRTQGLDKEDELGRVASNLRGKFSLAGGVMKVPSVEFEVPGAKISLTGASDLRAQTLALQGHLQMRASVSQAVGGFKSIFLKVADPFFRKNGMGAVVPIKIGGTFDAPAVGLNLRGKSKPPAPAPMVRLVPKSKTQK